VYKPTDEAVRQQQRQAYRAQEFATRVAATPFSRAMFRLQPREMNDAGHNLHLTAVVSGRVQVGFRFFVRKRHGVWACSGSKPSDGMVALEAEDQDAQELARRLERGPECAAVDVVQVSWGTKQGWTHEFEVRR
jgi:acylphosphatase